eukprot:261143_1
MAHSKTKHNARRINRFNDQELFKWQTAVSVHVWSMAYNYSIYGLVNKFGSAKLRDETNDGQMPIDTQVTQSKHDPQTPSIYLPQLKRQRTKLEKIKSVQSGQLLTDEIVSDMYIHIKVVCYKKRKQKNID